MRGERTRTGRTGRGASDDDAEIRHVELIWFLLIGLAAGWLAGQLLKRRGSGWVEDPTPGFP